MAKFVMRKLPDGMNESTGNLYPRMKCTGTTTLDDLAKQIAGATTFTPGDIKGVVAALVEEMARQMAQGRSVQIEGLGRFRASLKVSDQADQEREDGSTSRRTGKSVLVGGVNYTADPDLTQATNSHATLERLMPRNSQKPVMESLEERVQDAMEYLSHNHSISVSTYSQRTGLKKSTATCELRALAKDPASPIGSIGLGSHKVYVLKSEMQEDDD